MRKAAIAGLFAFSIFFVANSSSVNAEAFDILKINSNEQLNLSANSLEPIRLATAKESKQQPEVKPEPTIHEVKPGETLSSIAETYQTTWSHLFNKNEQITHPDVIGVGSKLTIPLPDEQLPDRLIPKDSRQPVTPQAGPVPSRDKVSAPDSSATYAAAPRGGNAYTPGYCTWYAKNMRPDLPGNLGNADTWVSRAAAQGIPTGSAPRAGAVGQQGMHVVYVQRVNADGTVMVSEMNYQGRYVISTRTVAASTFLYIY